MSLGFFIDNENCYGCKTCSIACKSEKQLGAGVLLREVRTFVQKEPRAVSFLSLSCNHCEEPACVEACPQGAYEKREDGIAVQDGEKCIGCQACVKACPYGAPSYDEELGRVFKCDTCVGRRERGLLPACVASCPGMNLALGDMDELAARERADVVSDPEAGTMPNFVIAVDPKLAESPEKLALKAE